MAVGRVCTGFSLPYVALYNESGGTVTYSDARKLARGVDVSVEPESSEGNTFYADNQAAESSDGVFTGGTVTLTVDGLKKDAETMIMGLPEEDDSGWSAYGDNQSVPYVGVGYVARYISDGVTTYVPTVLAKTKFAQVANSSATQEEEIDYQTQQLTATLFRGDDSNHNWKFVGKEYTTEALAEAALKTKLGVTSSAG